MYMIFTFILKYKYAPTTFVRLHTHAATCTPTHICVIVHCCIFPKFCCLQTLLRGCLACYSSSCYIKLQNFVAAATCLEFCGYVCGWLATTTDVVVVVCCCYCCCHSHDARKISNHIFNLLVWCECVLAMWLAPNEDICMCAANSNDSSSSNNQQCRNNSCIAMLQLARLLTRLLSLLQMSSNKLYWAKNLICTSICTICWRWEQDCGCNTHTRRYSQRCV